MITYKYTAMSQGGQKVDGMIEAIDELEATARIRSQYSAVLSLKEVRTAGSMLPAFLTMEVGSKRLDPKAFTLMCNQFATILAAGVPVARAVVLITGKTTNRTIKKILQKVGADVEAGRTLSSSFEEYGGELLPATFVETLRAGEEAGDIAGAFDSVYRHFDKQTKMNDKVRSAMLYPLFVLCIAVVVVMVLMVKVVPSFTEMFNEMGGELPLMTRVLIGISEFTRANILYFIVAIAIIVVGIIFVSKTEKGRMFFAKLMLRLPVLGEIEQLNCASLFANTMATMIGSGIPMTKAVGITSGVMPNYLIQTKVEGMVPRIEEGRTVVDSMREADCLPDILTDMVGVGEETGEM